MKSSRSWNRREFNVTSAGYFTVLKPTGWFSAASTSRLPAGIRYHIGPSEKAAASHVVETLAAEPVPAPEQQTLDHADIQETTIPPNLLMPTTHDYHWMRLSLSALFAAALTYFVLWWVFFRPHPVW
jgi:hypothetical protein